MKTLLRNLRQTLQDMLEETVYQERRDLVHHASACACALAAASRTSGMRRAANENTDRRATRWGVVEALTCVALSVSQVLYVRRLFKSKGGTLLPRFGV